MQDVSHRETHAAGLHDRRGRVLPIETVHMKEWIAGPTLAADFLVVMRIAVGADIQAGDLLIAKMNGHRVGVLFAKTRIHHCAQEGVASYIFRVPTRPWQGTDDRRWHCEVGRCVIHLRSFP